MGKLDKISDLVAKGKTDKVVKLTEDRDEEVAAAAFEALGGLSDPLALETLQNAIRDPSPKIRMAVAKSFQRCGNDHVSEALRHQMMVEKDPALKAAFEKAMNFCRGRRH